MGSPCHCSTIPWNSLLNRSTLTPMSYWLAVASSMAVMENEASPSTSTTIFSGAATLAPIAEGRPKPMVWTSQYGVKFTCTAPLTPRPPEETQLRGSVQR